MEKTDHKQLMNAISEYSIIITMKQERGGIWANTWKKSGSDSSESPGESFSGEDQE